MASQNDKQGTTASVKSGIDSVRGLALLFLCWPVLFGLAYIPALFGEWPVWYRLWVIVFLGIAVSGLVYLPKLVIRRRYTRFASFYTLVQAALVLVGAPLIGIPFVDAVPLMGLLIGAMVTGLVWGAALILAWSAPHAGST